MRLNNRSFILFDAIMAAFALAMFGSIVTITCYSLTTLKGQSQNALQAANFAASAAEKLMDKKALVGDPQYWPSDRATNLVYQGLELGEHSTGDICDLPDCYFRNVLKGKLKYNVKDVSAGVGLMARQVDITVAWTEKTTRVVSKKQDLTIVAALYTTTVP